MTAYYNEIDEKAVAWLRELIRQGRIAPGEVDTRSIEDVCPDDLAGFTQCHFFAGIGGWSYALRRAGWPDDHPVWTMSCPCQPFSSAGKGAGFDDERHLWPAAHWLIGQRAPGVVFGEQVASKDAEPWLDLVQADLEIMGYAFGACAFPSAGIGAPHIRDRAYWVADASGRGRGEFGHPAQPRQVRHADGGDLAGVVADTKCVGRERGRERGRPSETGGRLSFEPVVRPCDAGGMAVADGRDASAERQQRGGEQRQQPQDGGTGGMADAAGPRYPEAREHKRGQSQLPPRSAEHGGVVRPTGPVNGLWRDADWLFCRDGKWRPVEPGTFPLAHGAPARVGRLRGYGNAINAEAATAWIESYLAR